MGSKMVISNAYACHHMLVRKPAALRRNVCMITVRAHHVVLTKHVNRLLGLARVCFDADGHHKSGRGGGASVDVSSGPQIADRLTVLTTLQNRQLPQETGLQVRELKTILRSHG